MRLLVSAMRSWVGAPARRCSCATPKTSTAVTAACAQSVCGVPVRKAQLIAWAHTIAESTLMRWLRLLQLALADTSRSPPRLRLPPPPVERPSPLRLRASVDDNDVVVMSTGEELRLSQVVCSECGSGADEVHLLLCSGCTAAVHITCLSPALPAVPKEDWYCGASCAARSRRQEIAASTVKHSPLQEGDDPVRRKSADQEVVCITCRRCARRRSREDGRRWVHHPTACVEPFAGEARRRCPWGRRP